MHVNTKFREAEVDSSDAEMGERIAATEIRRMAGIIPERIRTRGIYLDSSRRGVKGGDKSLSQRTRTQQRRDGAGRRRTEPPEESRFGGDQLLKLFGHLLFAHDSFTQKDTKNRFEDFLCRWRDLRGPFASPCTVGWNCSYRGGRPRTRVLPFTMVLRRRGDLAKFFEIFRTDRRKRDSHPHACLRGNHFSARVNCSLGSIQDELDGRVDRKRRQHFNVTTAERNVRHLHRKIHRAEFVEDGRFDSTRNARETPALNSGRGGDQTCDWRDGGMVLWLYLVRIVCVGSPFCKWNAPDVIAWFKTFDAHVAGTRCANLA